MQSAVGGGTSSEPLILVANRDGFYNPELGRYMTYEDFVEINESGRLIFARFGYTQPLSIVLVDLDADPVTVHCNLLWFDDYNLVIKASRYTLYSNGNLDYREYETSELTPWQ